MQIQRFDALLRSWRLMKFWANTQYKGAKPSWTSWRTRLEFREAPTCASGFKNLTTHGDGGAFIFWASYIQRQAEQPTMIGRSRGPLRRSPRLLPHIGIEW